jgi:hypothetical protein
MVGQKARRAAEKAREAQEEHKSNTRGTQESNPLSPPHPLACPRLVPRSRVALAGLSAFRFQLSGLIPPPRPGFLLSAFCFHFVVALPRLSMFEVRRWMLSAPGLPHRHFLRPPRLLPRKYITPIIPITPISPTPARPNRLTPSPFGVLHCCQNGVTKGT